jgi:TonB-dependent starch-binding outer membrane protein SusC
MPDFYAFVQKSFYASAFVMALCGSGHSAFAQNVAAPGSPTSDSLSAYPSSTNAPVPIGITPGYNPPGYTTATGAAVSIQENNFNKGLITSFDQLITGQVPGMRITQKNGAPGAGYDLSIWGRTGLGHNSTPLIILDGIQIVQTDLIGSENPLNLINPADIESIQVLKDAAATAIYGHIAAAGVIIINTKRAAAGDRLSVRFSTMGALSLPASSANMLNADQYRELINQRGNPDEIHLLGNASTNWQEEISRTAFSHDNTLEVSGSVKALPYRVSVGLLDQNGVIKTSNLNRKSASVTLNPTFFNNTLKVNASLRRISSTNRYVDNRVIGNALAFDPTQPVWSPNRPGQYFEWLNEDGTSNYLAPQNPLGILNHRQVRGQVNRTMANAHIHYALPFIPGLGANLNLAYDRNSGTLSDLEMAGLATNPTQSDRLRESLQNYTHKLGEFYLNYTTSLPKIKSTLHVTTGTSLRIIQNQLTFPDSWQQIPQSQLNMFGSVHYTFSKRYSLSSSINRSNLFDGPYRGFEYNTALGAAWNIKEESFLKDKAWLSQLTLRTSYGTLKNTSYHPVQPFYVHGTGSFPGWADSPWQVPYNRNLTAPHTQIYNAGLDMSLAGNTLHGSINYFRRANRSMVLELAIPAGSNGQNTMLINGLDLHSNGLDVALNYKAIQTSALVWNVGLNAMYVTSTINSTATYMENSNVFFQPYQVYKNGHSPGAFHAYKQVYHPDGKPLDGLYADLSGDGIINENDMYASKNPDPSLVMGISSNLKVGKWQTGLLLRGHAGNWVHNSISSGYGNNASFQYHLVNAHSSVLYTNAPYARHFSDYYLENAAFLRLDNLYLQYTLNKNICVTAAVQNAFVLTRYSGTDPEQYNGLDAPALPRPRTISLGTSIGF